MASLTYSKVELHTQLRCPDCLALIPLTVTLKPTGGKRGHLRAKVPKKWGRVVTRHARESDTPHPTFTLKSTRRPWR